MLCLVLGSGLLKLDFLQAVIDRLQVLESGGAVIEPLNRFHSCRWPFVSRDADCSGQLSLANFDGAP